ncbi:hypothetical protein [Nocardioides pantholopis]|uniref:hypothetical protein n=1 Tax=Nocardioides pantholopis TaxID=2483798 RepID=UPI000F074E67|nr:hypothetical protein [Nocardioides pantholopis]
MSALPDGTVLLHIGPHKTGTTAVQMAFHENRPALAAQGVEYAGASTQPMVEAMAVASGQSFAVEHADSGMRRWRELVDEVHASPARVVVLSSEFFSEASPERVRRILDDLGPERTHVVVTLRPVFRILASQWQQYMQNRPLLGYDDALDYAGWLDRVLNSPENPGVTPSFWKRHRHDRLVQTWAEAIGADRVTAIVVDESDRRMLLRAFEDLTGLADGTLVAEAAAENRSLTLAEVSMLRAFNRRFLEHGWSAADYTRYLRFGAIRFLLERVPDPAEERLLTPQWAVDRAAELGAEMAGGIRASGVRVVGDLDRLGDPTLARGVGDNTADVPVPQEVWTRFLAGLLVAVVRTPGVPPPPTRTPGPLEVRVREERGMRAWGSDPEALRRRVAELTAQVERARRVDEVSRPALLAEVARRIAARAVRRAPRLRRTRRS